jgi:RimJ/RimL family protein N-acetyltransferase
MVVLDQPRRSGRPTLATHGLDSGGMAEVLASPQRSQSIEAERIRAMIARDGCPPLRGWLVVREDGSAVAAIGYTEPVSGVREYWAVLASSVTGREAAVIAATGRGLLRFQLAEKNTHFRRAQCLVVARNQAARRFAERIGFACEGVLRDYCPLYGSMRMMAMTRTRILGERAGSAPQDAARMTDFDAEGVAPAKPEGGP